jgi:hypothetical protein
VGIKPTLGADGNYQNIDQSVLDFTCTARILKIRKLLDQLLDHGEASSQKSKKASYLSGD